MTKTLKSFIWQGNNMCNNLGGGSPQHHRPAYKYLRSWIVTIMKLFNRQQGNSFATFFCRRDVYIRTISSWLLFSMTQLLTHTVAHSTEPSFRLKTNNQPLKKFLSLALSWTKVVKNGYILTFKVNFLCQKISESF